MVKNPRVQFYLPKSVADAMRLKQEFGESVEFVGGGTDLVLKLRRGVKTPIGLIQLPHCSGPVCWVEDGFVRISALCTITELVGDVVLGQQVPLLREALGRIGSPQIRNISTLGGNLVNACPACDSAPALLAYGASVKLETIQGHRVLPVERFFAGPSKTEIHDNELLTEIHIPVPERVGEHTFFYKFGPRGSNVIASANLAVRVVVAESRVSSVRLAAGSIAPVPSRLRNVENILLRRSLDELDTIQMKAEITKLLTKDISPISDIRGSRWYKSKAIEMAIFRVLEDLSALRQQASEA